MSTIKSSSENLTLNADGANNDIIFQSNGSTKATLDQAGLLTATTFAGVGSTPSITDGGNATAITIDSSENVGIGTASLGGGRKLTVAGGAIAVAGQNTSHSASNMVLGQDSTSISQIRFYGANTSTAGILQFIGSSSNGTVGGERMRIDSIGAVTMPLQPSCLVKSFSAVSANNFVTGGTVVHNVGSHYSTSTGKFTAPVAGRYFVSASLLTSNTNARVEIAVQKNGATVVLGDESTGSSAYGTANLSTVVILAANEYLQVKLLLGTMHNGNAGSYFSVHLLA